MKNISGVFQMKKLLIAVFTLFLLESLARISCADLAEVKHRGTLRHLGIPYANFVTGAGDGMDVELMQRFAQHLGVKYQYVQTEWNRVFSDLTGNEIISKGNDVIIGAAVPIMGDVAASGLTILPWREKIVSFSHPIFPNQIWLVARSGSPIHPIKPTKKLQRDIVKVKSLIRGHSLLGKNGTCLDPALYGLQGIPTKTIFFSGSLNDLAPALINGKADLVLLDVPDALVALQKWPGEIKVIGPVSGMQEMAVAFSKNAPRLREEFNRFLKRIVSDGSYLRLVEKYYPHVLRYYPDFISNIQY